MIIGLFLLGVLGTCEKIWKKNVLSLFDVQRGNGRISLGGGGPLRMSAKRRKNVTYKNLVEYGYYRC